jgi:hypothetical protein
MFAVCILPVTATNFFFFHLRAHAKLQDADVENESPLLPSLKLIEPLEMTMDDIVTSSCEELVSVLRRSKPLAVGGEGANLN